METYKPEHFRQPPPLQTHVLISFPHPHILLVVLNRPQQLNALNSTAQYELERLFSWYDAEPHLRCAVITGAGRAFCAGADLKEWWQRVRHSLEEKSSRRPIPSSGFGGLSRRRGKKPVVAAVNGLAFGGGMEVVANQDLVVASQSAVFALPEVKHGVVAMEGALPRLVRTIGRPRTMELALTGRPITAEEAHRWGLVNAVTADHASSEVPILDRPVVQRALEYASIIAANSPDSMIISRSSVLAGWEHGSVESATQLIFDSWEGVLHSTDNYREGLVAFTEKRNPKWVDSKL